MFLGPKTRYGSRRCVTPDLRCCRGGSWRIHQVLTIGQQGTYLPMGSHVQTKAAAAEEGSSSTDKANRRPEWTKELHLPSATEQVVKWTDGGAEALHCNDDTPSIMYTSMCPYDWSHSKTYWGRAAAETQGGLISFSAHLFRSESFESVNPTPSLDLHVLRFSQAEKTRKKIQLPVGISLYLYPRHS